MDERSPLRLPDPCLVVLVGATAAGKSQWAQRCFDDDEIVSSDRLRAVVGTASEISGRVATRSRCST